MNSTSLSFLRDGGKYLSSNNSLNSYQKIPNLILLQKQNIRNGKSNKIKRVSDKQINLRKPKT